MGSQPQHQTHGASPLPGMGTGVTTGVPFAFTRYSLYIILAMFGVTLTKAVNAYMGDSVIPTTLEFIFGGIFTIGMYWIGLYQPVRPERFKYFLHDHISLRSAVVEAILAAASAGYIYCYVALMREPSRPDELPRTLLFFLFCFPALCTYILRWRWVAAGVSHLTQWDRPILWTMKVLFLVPLVKTYFWIRFTSYKYYLFSEDFISLLLGTVVGFVFGTVAGPPGSTAAGDLVVILVAILVSTVVGTVVGATAYIQVSSMASYLVGALPGGTAGFLWSALITMTVRLSLKISGDFGGSHPRTSPVSNAGS